MTKKKKREKNDLCFLTVWGLETDLPFGSTKNKKKPSFFEPIFKELKKRIKKSKTKSFPVLRICKERTTVLLKVEKEIKNLIIKKLHSNKKKKKPIFFEPIHKKLKKKIKKSKTKYFPL